MGTVTLPDQSSVLLFGAVRRAVLALLLGRPDERFYLREIVRSAGRGTGAVQRELGQLVSAGLVVRESSGHQVYFSANRSAPIFPELQSIIQKTAGAADILRSGLAALVRKGMIEVALVYGSVARGEQTSKSDVDLLVVGSVTLAELVPLLRKAEGLLGREVNATVYPVKEFRSKSKHAAPFLKRVLTDAKLFVVGDEADLTRLAR
ncbi:MAG: nucleotidyltransferase domain-containing protein [Gemmatimonadota bacterium]